MGSAASVRRDDEDTVVAKKKIFFSLVQCNKEAVEEGLLICAKTGLPHQFVYEIMCVRR